jgi:hypothetical protein
VQVEYQGTIVTTGFQPLDQKGDAERHVGTVHWDFVWSGMLDELLLPMLHGHPKGNMFTPRTLTGTIAIDYPAGMGNSCEGDLSLGKRGRGTDGWFRTLNALSLTAYPGTDPSTIVVGVQAPATADTLQSSDVDCAAEAVSAGAVDSKQLLIPRPVFSVANLAASQVKSYSGNEKTVSNGDVYTTTVRSTITFGGAACRGSGSAGSAAGLAPLYACYVALGDSYSSGQMPPFVPGGEVCARSTLAYAYLYDRQVAFWACSGATINSVLDEQLPYVRTTTKLVTVTVGGNDTPLFGNLTRCLARSFSPVRCANAFAVPNFASLRGRLVSLYQAIHTQGPSARIVVFGYPNPLPPTEPIGCSALYLPGTRIGVFPSDVAYFHRLITDLNTTVQQAVAASGVASYVSPDLIFNGHDICARSSYFFPLELENALKTLHPNAEGHEQLAALLRQVAGPTPD